VSELNRQSYEETSFGAVAQMWADSGSYQYILVCELDGRVEQEHILHVLVDMLGVPVGAFVQQGLAACRAKSPLPFDLFDEAVFPYMSSVAFLNELPRQLRSCRYSYAAVTSFLEANSLVANILTPNQLARNMKENRFERLVTWSDLVVDITLSEQTD
jgi:hypothetical protein